ncbi:MAG: hypothetical protein QMD04_07090 [Anaerolineales bacterium]|nr:hypothetical protein [Anaerolineales bacterium]
MKAKLVQAAKVFLLILSISLLFIVAVAVITREVQDSLVDTPNKNWREYETAILSACYADVFLPSEKLCEWEIITQHGNTIYVWAFCADVNGQGSSGPLVVYIRPSGEVEKAICPLIFDDYKTLFPGESYEEVNNYRDRFDLDRAWSHLEMRFQDRTIPPLIAIEGTPLP